MSATIHEETLTVSRDILIDAIAALLAASGLAAVEDKKLYPEYRSDAIAGEAARLQVELFGRWPEGDEERVSDPLEVELTARSADIEARMIDACMESRLAGEKARASLMARDGRSGRLREYAKRTRGAGRGDVTFPSSAETLEAFRLKMNAEVDDDAR